MGPMGRLRNAPVSAGLASALVLLSSIVIAVPSLAQLFVLVPGLAFTGPSMLPNLLTASLVESNIVKLCASAAVLVMYAPIGEAAQGSAKFALFLGLCVLGSSLAASVVEVGMFLSSRDDKALFREVHGASGIVVACALAVHQAAPDLALFSAPSWLPSAALRARRLPFAMVVILGTAAALGLTSDGLFLVMSFVGGWAYLRFMQPQTLALPRLAGRSPADTREASRPGDGRDHMAFAALFPQPVRGLVQPLSAAVGACTRRCLPEELGNGNALQADGQATSAAAGGAYAAMPAATRGSAAGVLGADDGMGEGGALDPVAERRREKARKSLDARLAELERRRLQRGPSVSAARQLAGGPPARPEAATTQSAKPEPADSAPAPAPAGQATP